MRSWTLLVVSVGLLAGLSACDDTVDCKTGQTQECYGGPEGTKGIGLCAAGWRGCVSGKWDQAACVGEIVPSVEVCDGLDNNCDGEIDEGLLNACGGCRPLDAAPGASCGTCSLWACDGKDALECQGPQHVLGAACRADSGCAGTYACEEGAVFCEAPAKNACGTCGGPEITGLGEECTNAAGCPGQRACAADGSRLVCYGPSKNNCGVCGLSDVPGAGASCMADNGCPGQMLCNEQGTSVACATTLEKNECGLCGGGPITGLGEACENAVGCAGTTVCNTSGDSTLCNAPGKNNCDACGKPQVLGLSSSCVADNGCNGIRVCGDEGTGFCQGPARNACDVCGGQVVSDIGETCLHGNGCQGSWTCNSAGNGRLCVSDLISQHGSACTYGYEDGEGQQQTCASTYVCDANDPTLPVCQAVLKNECGLCGGPAVGDLGAACTSADECTGVKVCDPSDSASVCDAPMKNNCGVCVHEDVADIGDPCVYTDPSDETKQCPSLFACNDTLDAATCAPVLQNECGLCAGPAVAELGLACTTDEGCDGFWECNAADDGRICVGEVKNNCGVCGAPDVPDVGTACTAANECPSTYTCNDTKDAAVCLDPSKNACGKCEGPEITGLGDPCASSDGCAGAMVCNEAKDAAVCDAPLFNNCGSCLHDDVPGIGTACELPNGCFTMWNCHPSQPGERVCPFIGKNECEACGGPPLPTMGEACATADGCQGTKLCAPNGWSLVCSGEIRNACDACSLDFAVTGLGDACTLDGCDGSNVCSADGLGVVCNATKNNCGDCNVADVTGLGDPCTTGEDCSGFVDCDPNSTGTFCAPLEIANECGLCGGAPVADVGAGCTVDSCSGLLTCNADQLSVSCDARLNNCSVCNVPDVPGLGDYCPTDAGCTGALDCDAEGTGSLCKPLELPNECGLCGGAAVTGLTDPCTVDGCLGELECGLDRLSTVCGARLNNCGTCNADDVPLGPCTTDELCAGNLECDPAGTGSVCVPIELANECGVCGGAAVPGYGEVCSAAAGCDGTLTACSADGLSATCSAFLNNCGACNVADVLVGGDCLDAVTGCAGILECDAAGTGSVCTATEFPNECGLCDGAPVTGLGEACSLDGCDGQLVCAADKLSTECGARLNNCEVCNVDDVDGLGDECTDDVSGCAGHLVCSADGLSAECDAPASCAGAHVVISEIAAKGLGGANDEFVELHNPSPAAVDLGGWSLQYRSASGTSFAVTKLFPAGTTVAAQGYLLVGHTGYDGATVAADLTYANGLSGTGGTVALVSSAVALPDLADPTLVDLVGYGTGATFEGSGPALIHADAGSIERKASATSDAASMEGGTDALAGNGHDSDDNAADFVLRTLRDPQNSLSATEP